MGNISQFQKFEMRVIPRSEIKSADYNPRIISPQAKARLKKGIVANGLVSPLIWNERTGNLTGGHQRLSSIDDLEASEDYSLNVAVINVSEEQERRINVLLNNDSTQGFWDEKKLLEMFKTGDDEEVDFEAFGFSRDQEDYFSNMMEAADKENEELVAMMSDNLAFEADVEATYKEQDDEAYNKKVEAKKVFEASIDEMMVDQKPSEWKVKTDEEKKEYEKARSSFRDRSFGYEVVKIAFDSLDEKKNFLAQYSLPSSKETFHISEFNAPEGAET